MIVTGFEGDFHTKYHVAKMRHRAEVHALRRLQRRALEILETTDTAPKVRLHSLLSEENEFDQIIAANTENPVPTGKARHRADNVRLSWDQRLFAWWVGHVA